MSLQLVVGNSGNGKTTWVHKHVIEESMKHPEKQYFILVPEQFTMETQKAIVKAHPRKGTMNIEVTSFVRLAHKVFEAVGFEDYVVLDDMGKCVLLQKAARKNASRLSVFGRNLKKPGFIDELKSMMSELYQYGVTADMLEQAFEKTDSTGLLSGKLKDMIVIYRAFVGEMDKNTLTAEEILPLLAKYLPDSRLLDGAVVVLDEYTGFTPIQYQVIRTMLHHVEKLFVTVTADPASTYRRDCAEHDLFYLSRHTVASLLACAREEESPVDADICLTVREKEEAVRRSLEAHKYAAEIVVPEGNRFTGSGELSFLEQNIMRYGGSPYDRGETIGDISLSYCPSPAEEVRMICEEIYELAMEKGIRYREMAIITGKPDIYNPLFAHELDSYGIPCFVDEKHDLLRNPLVEYIRSLIDVAEQRFSYESVFRHLKCGISLIEREERDYLENYCIARGIRGPKAWSKTWLSESKEGKKGNGTDFMRLDQARKIVWENLGSFYESWKKEDNTVADLLALLTSYLAEHELEDRVNALSDRFYENGDKTAAKEYAQAYEAVMKLFKEIASLMGSEKMSRKDFAACLDSGLAEIKVGVIPACVDRLVVGDMERTRLSGIRVLFFAGVNEGQVPALSNGGGIFTDYDKEKLKNLEIELAPTGRMNSFMSRFYLYLALTKPSESLRISCAKNDAGGKSLHPAACIQELLRLFPTLKARDLDDPACEKSLPVGTNGIWRYLVRGFHNLKEAMEDELWLSVFSYYYETKRDMTEALLFAYSDGYHKESLTRELAIMLYGRALNASVSRLETQAACAFSHYLKYGLKLEERETFSFERTDMGNLFHKAIERCFKACERDGISVTELEEEDRKRLVEICVREAVTDTGSDILNENARNKWLKGRLERITDRTIWALSNQLKEGGYVTEGCEVRFDADSSRVLTIPLNEASKMLLTGKIDRVDTRTADDRVYVRIVDYKSGKTSFDLVSVYYGTQIQLVFYMEAAEEALKKQQKDKEIIPGGVLYYNISDPIIEKTKGLSKDKVNDAVLKELRMNGMINLDALEEADKAQYSGKGVAKITAVDSDKFRLLQKHVHEQVRQLGLEIMEGKIDVNPYRHGKTDSCRFCSYGSICGFDTKRSGYRFRSFDSMKKDEIWEELKKEDEEDGNNVDE